MGYIFLYPTSMHRGNMRSFGEALNILERQVKLDNGKSHKNDLYKTYVCIVIIHLALNDYTAADRAYQSFLAYVVPRNVAFLYSIEEDRNIVCA